MTARWWGRAAGLTIVAALLAGSTAAAPAAGGAVTRSGAGWELIGRAADGRIVVQVALPRDGFTLEYRNSVYRSPAAEHFAVTDAGRLALVELTAVDPAVLQEYYGVTDRLRRVATGLHEGWWLGSPAEPLELDALVVAATRHGERTVVVDGSRPIVLWQAVGAAGPQVTLEVRRAA